tara:strand:- start:21 stop:272 length:252 start_codon:yes stop_codon:yes gene_type:complete
MTTRRRRIRIGIRIGIMIRRGRIRRRKTRKEEEKKEVKKEEEKWYYQTATIMIMIVIRSIRVTRHMVDFSLNIYRTKKFLLPT